MESFYTSNWTLTNLSSSGLTDPVNQLAELSLSTPSHLCSPSSNQTPNNWATFPTCRFSMACYINTNAEPDPATKCLRSRGCFRLHRQKTHNHPSCLCQNLPSSWLTSSELLKTSQILTDYNRNHRIHK